MVKRGDRDPWKRALGREILEARRLVSRHLAAQGRQAAAGPGDNTPFEDVFDLVSDVLLKEIESASQESLLRRLDSLERAYRKVQAGTYGECEACGQPIPRRRLEAMPEALYCVPCQEAHERAAARSHTGTRWRRR